MAEDKVTETQTVVDEVAKTETKTKEVVEVGPLKNAEPIVKEAVDKKEVSEDKEEKDSHANKNGTNCTEEQDQKNSEGKEDLDESTPIPDLIAKGTKAFWLHNYTEAVSIFGSVSERLVKQHEDELNDELGNVYLYYGKSLLELAREQSDPFGEGVPTEVAVGVAGDEEESDESSDDDDDDDDEEEEEVDDDEENKGKTEGGDNAKTEKVDEKMETNGEESSHGQESEKESADSEKTSQDTRKESQISEKESLDTSQSQSDDSHKHTQESMKLSPDTDGKPQNSQSSEISVNGESILDSQSSTTGISSQTSSSESQSEATSTSGSQQPIKGLNTTLDSSTADSCAGLRCSDKLQTSEDSGEEEESDENEDGEPSEEGASEGGPKWPATDPTDLQLAWEVLELAKKIFIRREDKGKQDYADCLVALAEVSMEGENFDSAISDLNEAIKVLEEINAEELHTRKFAHTHYTLGMVLCGNNKPEESIVCYETTLRLLRAHLAHLMAVESSGPSDDREMNEVLGLIPEIEEKISDLQSFIEESQKSRQDVPLGTKAKEPVWQMDGATTSAGKTVTNISHLVKRKRDDDVDGQGDCPPKKPAA